MKSLVYSLGFCAVMVVSSFSSALAGTVTIPNTFTAGTAAQAAQVNANFSAIDTAVDDNAADISANTTAIGTKQNRVSGSCPTGQSIRVINADGTVQCENDDVGTGITGVTAGSGLTGGGTSGTVTLSVATGGITGSHIATGTITASDIATGGIIGADIASSTITGTHIASGSIGGSDIATNAITGGHIATGAITGEVVSFELFKIGFTTTFMISVSCAQHGWPGKFNTQISFDTIAFQFPAVLINNNGLNSG